VRRQIAGFACFFIIAKGSLIRVEETYELTKEEKEVLQIIQTIGYGKVVVTVKNGKPVYVETQKTIQLTK